MQQAHRTMRHQDGGVSRPETVPFDKQMLQRAARNEPLDATLPGVAVDPSLPLILTTRRERLVLKHPSEFEPRAPTADRTLARLLIVCTAVAVAAIVFAAAPSLDIRALLGLRRSSVQPAASRAATAEPARSLERVTPPSKPSAGHAPSPLVAGPATPPAAVMTMAGEAQMAAVAPAVMTSHAPPSSAISPLTSTEAPAEVKASPARKSTAVSSRATKRSKRKARSSRSTD